MPCEMSDEQLAAFVAGDLLGEQAETMRTHLDECELCRDMVERLRRADAGLVQTMGRAVPRAVAMRVREALRQETGEQEIDQNK